jgi:hypothetical protein
VTRQVDWKSVCHFEQALVRNFDLTVDEIKTIAGGVMKTERRAESGDRGKRISVFHKNPSLGHD